MFTTKKASRKVATGLAVLMLLAGPAWLTGCGATGSGDDAAKPDETTGPADDAAGDPATGEDAGTSDAPEEVDDPCPLIAQDDIEQALGVTVTEVIGYPGTCHFIVNDTQGSQITVEVSDRIDRFEGTTDDTFVSQEIVDLPGVGDKAVYETSDFQEMVTTVDADTYVSVSNYHSAGPETSAMQGDPKDRLIEVAKGLLEQG